jgi:hypothetical protein
MSDPYRGSTIGWLTNVFTVLVIVLIIAVVLSR